MSEKRVVKHRTILKNISSWWLRKPLEEATKQDLKAVYVTVMKWDNREYGPYEPWTKSDYLKVVKRFFKW